MADQNVCTQIDVLRHGQCEGGHIFRGDTDVALSPEGFSAMRERCCAQINSGRPPWDVVLSSPLQRCLTFAEHLCNDLSLPLEVHDALREMSFGQWEARKILDVMQEDAQRMRDWGDDPAKHTPPGGEALADVFARVQSVYSELLHTHRGKHILLVTHGGVFRVLLAQVLDMSASRIQRFDVPYACLSRFAVFHSDRGDIPKLLAHNMRSPMPTTEMQ